MLADGNAVTDTAAPYGAGRRRSARLARWQTFQPPTQQLLAQIEAREGVVVAEALAEAIRSEVTQAPVMADLAIRSLHA